MPAQALSFDGFTEDEIVDAYEMCVTHQEEFLSNDPGGQYLRQEALKHFKDAHPECKTIEQLAMYADLENDTDVKNACVIKIDAQRYAKDMLST